MVLTEYSEKKKKEGKDSIETIMSLIEFPLLDQTSSNSVISTTPNELVKTLLFMAPSILLVSDRAGKTGFEPATSGVTDQHSNQLSYFPLS